MWHSNNTHWPVNFCCIWVLKNKLNYLEYISWKKPSYDTGLPWVVDSTNDMCMICPYSYLSRPDDRSRLFGSKTSQCGRWAAAFHQLNSLSTCQSGASKPHSPSSSLFLSVDLSSTSTSRSMKKWVRSFGGWLQSRSKMELMWFVFLELNSNW